jgi:hypothetical protein
MTEQEPTAFIMSMPTTAMPRIMRRGFQLRVTNAAVFSIVSAVFLAAFLAVSAVWPPVCPAAGA